MKVFFRGIGTGIVTCILPLLYRLLIELWYQMKYTKGGNTEKSESA